MATYQGSVVTDEACDDQGGGCMRRRYKPHHPHTHTPTHTHTHPHTHTPTHTHTHPTSSQGLAVLQMQAASNIWLVGFHILATSKVISGGYRLAMVHTHGDFISAAPLGNQATSTMSCYPTQSHCPDTDLTSPYPILIMLNTRLEKIAK